MTPKKHSRVSILELWAFMKVRKKWWLSHLPDASLLGLLW
jgi:hypothetical protein